MGEFRLPHRADHAKDGGEKWGECVLCGLLRRRALVHFDSGSVTPTQYETVTGATSGDTMVLDRYVLISGTFAGGDAVGVFEGTSPTGYDDAILEIFQDNENLNGSASGANFATVNKTGAIEVSGRLVSDAELIEYRGKTYCRPHFKFKFENDWKDEIKVDRKEGDRE